jgi:hypothetical protein
MIFKLDPSAQISSKVLRPLLAGKTDGARLRFSDVQVEMIHPFSVQFNMFNGLGIILCIQ